MSDEEKWKQTLIHWTLFVKWFFSVYSLYLATVFFSVYKWFNEYSCILDNLFIEIFGLISLLPSLTSHQKTNKQEKKRILPSGLPLQPKYVLYWMYNNYSWEGALLFPVRFLPSRVRTHSHKSLQWICGCCCNAISLSSLHTTALFLGRVFRIVNFFPKKKNCASDKVISAQLKQLHCGGMRVRMCICFSLWAFVFQSSYLKCRSVCQQRVPWESANLLDVFESPSWSK